MIRAGRVRADRRAAARTSARLFVAGASRFPFLCRLGSLKGHRSYALVFDAASGPPGRRIVFTAVFPYHLDSITVHTGAARSPPAISRSSNKRLLVL